MMKERIDIVSVKMVRDGSIPYGKKPIRGPPDLADIARKFIGNADREMFILVCLNVKNYVNCIHLVSVGTLSQTILSVREIFKAVFLSNSAKVAFIHNHPSGCPEPSAEDIAITEKLTRCAELFDVGVVDHVVVGDEGRFESLSERGVIKTH